MSDLTLEVPTTKSGMDEIRTALDAALAKEFPGGMLRRNWAGDTLELSGPGAKGVISFEDRKPTTLVESMNGYAATGVRTLSLIEDGKLVGRASLGPPASMMRGMIEQKIGTAMRTAAA